ncbi:MAG: hypothetical protein RPU39_10845 [Candidatus Sedimenticola sp. (ex Thyasira tokunagai)]
MFGTYRTLLALMVVALHLGGIPKVGAYAVFGFYCLSGYLMTLIMHSNYGYTLPGISKYAVNRALRIFPLYWVSILFSAVLIWQLGSNFISSYHPAIYMPGNASELSKNLMIFFPFMDVPRLTPPAWALTVELFFYILIGAGISKNKGITLIWFVFSVLYHIGALFFDLGWSHRYYTIAAASLPFSTGALIFHYRHSCCQCLNQLSGRGGIYLYLFFFQFWLIGG